jgi:hypothetical protein
VSAYGPPCPVSELILAAEGAACADCARVTLRLAEGDPVQYGPHRRREAGALISELRFQAPDLPPERSDRPVEAAVGPPRLNGGLDHARLPVIALGDQPVCPVSQDQEPAYQFLVSHFFFRWWCDAHPPEGLARVGLRGSRRDDLLLSGLSRIRRICRNRNCWRRCCDADADYGNQGALQWSSSCRWSVGRPLQPLQRSPASHLLHAACQRQVRCRRRCRVVYRGAAKLTDRSVNDGSNTRTGVRFRSCASLQDARTGGKRHFPHHDRP